jgi:hypothetical protein
MATSRNHPGERRHSQPQDPHDDRSFGQTSRNPTDVYDQHKDQVNRLHERTPERADPHASTISGLTFG